MKNLGIILIIVGAVMMIAGMLGDPLGIGFLSDLCDFNAYTLGAFFLCVIGLISHIVINKRIVD
jgi:uncharacterized membrane protein